MPRELAAGLRADVSGAAHRLIFFIEGEFRSGPLRITSEVGGFNWNGNNWNGPAGSLSETGQACLLEMESITEAYEIEAIGLKFKITGLPSRYLTACREELKLNNKVRVWIGVLDANGQLSGDPYQVFEGFLDASEEEEGETTSEITVMAESEWINRRPAGRRLTLEDQKREFPTDTGLRYAGNVALWKGTWGNRQVSSPAGTTTPGGAGTVGGGDTGRGGIVEPRLG